MIKTLKNLLTLKTSSEIERLKRYDEVIRKRFTDRRVPDIENSVLRNASFFLDRATMNVVIFNAIDQAFASEGLDKYLRYPYPSAILPVDFKTIFFKEFSETVFGIDWSNTNDQEDQFIARMLIKPLSDGFTLETVVSVQFEFTNADSDVKVHVGKFTIDNLHTMELPTGLREFLHALKPLNIKTGVRGSYVDPKELLI